MKYLVQINDDELYYYNDIRMYNIVKVKKKRKKNIFTKIINYIFFNT